jgi:hypothetical protein
MSLSDKFYILEVDINNGIPDFENYRTLDCVKRPKGVLKIPDCYYGLDGKIYILYFSEKVGLIEFNDNGQAKYTDNILPETVKSYHRNLYFVSSWFSDDYHTVVCTPKIRAENTCLGSTIKFSVSNYSGVTSFRWIFGDGDISLENQPIHQYKTPGKYTVKLIIDGNGTYETTIEVYPNPTPPKIIEK